jgi:hypothetical protein
MKLNTMAAVMTFVSKIEEDSASFYADRAEGFPELKDMFLAWVKENRKFEKQVKRTYFGVITDTLESNYCFETLDSEKYEFQTTLAEGADLSEAMGRALEIEETIKHFYLEAARLSDGLMADIPRLFKKIAKKREERCNTLSAA